MSSQFVDTSSLAGIDAASRRPRPTPTPPRAPTPPPNRDGSRRGDAAVSGRTNPVNPQQPLGANSGRQSQNTVGVLFPRPYSDVFVDTSSLQGVMNAMNPGSPTWVGGYFAGSPGRPGTLPKYGSAQVQSYDWLFGIIAKDYYSTSTAKKWYEEQFLQEALNVSRTEGRMVNVVDLAYEYAVNKGLLNDRGELTPQGEEAYRIYLGEKPSSSGGSGSRSYSSGGGGYGGGGGGGGGSVSLTDPTSARGLLMQTMQGVLGRNPTEQEYSQFVKALGQAEMGAPRTVGFEGDLAVQSGGIDPGMVAMEYVQGLDEFESAEGQRAFGAFMQVLGA
jgi:hypothetical protein